MKKKVWLFWSIGNDIETFFHWSITETKYLLCTKTEVFCFFVCKVCFFAYNKNHHTHKKSKGEKHRIRTNKKVCGVPQGSHWGHLKLFAITGRCLRWFLLKTHYVYMKKKIWETKKKENLECLRVHVWVILQ